MKIFYSLLLSFFIGGAILSAQCSISAVSVFIEEDCNTNLFDAEITFNFANTSDSFKIVGNGMNYGTYAYGNLPITLLGLETSCNLIREFVIVDQDMPNCTDFVDAGIVCCPECEVEIIGFSIGSCIMNDNVEISFNLDTSNVSGVGFDVLDEAGNVSFYSYNQLPVTIIFDAPINEENLYIQVCDNDNPNCCDQIDFDNPCYSGQSQCEIWDVNVLTECYTSGGFFDAEISFLYSNTSDSFDILGNGTNYGRFNYNDIPITLSALQADCNTAYEFVIVDAVEPSCTDFNDVGVICCDACALTNLVLTPGNCTNGAAFDLEIYFDFMGTLNDFFDWEVVGVDQGYDEFENLPITLSLENNNTEILTVIICENDNPSCCVTGTFINPCYSVDSCTLYDMTYIIECDSSNNTFDIELNMLYMNTADSFEIVGNGVNYGTYAYSNLPITITGLTADCDLAYEFIAIDLDNPNCSTFVEVGEVCCGNGASCELWDLNVSTECDTSNATFDVEITFLYANTSDSFKILGNGMNYGTYAYVDLPVTITGLIADCDTEYEFVIIDNDSPNCTVDEDLGEVCCGNGGICELWDLNVSTECDTTNTTFDVEISFLYANTSDSFKILGNGMNYGTYAYADLPVTITGLAADCDTEYEFVIVDNDSPNCTVDEDLGEVCCGNGGTCELWDLNVSTECDTTNTTFDVEITFLYANTSDSFKILGNGMNYGTYAYVDLPVTITGLAADCDTEYEFVIVDNDSPNCTVDEDLGEVCCGNGASCELWDLNVSTECDTSNTTFDVEITFLYANTSDSFKILGNGMNYGTYAYVDLPVTITGLIADCDTEYEFVIVDNDSPNCAVDEDLGEVCCGNGGTCELWDLNVSTECDTSNTTFDVEITFLYANTSDSFKILGNGMNYGTYAYADLPVTITELIADCDTEYEFVISDNDSPNCAVDEDLGEVCCGNGGICELWDLNVSTECDTSNSTFDVEITFLYANTSDSFKILGNGMNYGTYAYVDLPITITGLAADCDTEYEFVIVDNDSPNCAVDDDLGEVCCGNGGMNRIINLDVVTALLADGKYILSLSVDHTTTQDCSIEIYLNESLLGNLESDETTFEIGEFSCEDDETLSFKLINTCEPDETYSFTLDLTEIDCSTATKDLLEDIDFIYDFEFKTLVIKQLQKNDLQLSIYNLNGQLIESQLVDNKIFTKSFNAYLPGMYIIKLESQSDLASKSLVKKVIIH